MELSRGDLSEKDRAELEFWERDYAQYKGQDYSLIRAYGLPVKMQWFPEFRELTGTGLDVGCGPGSIFEGSHLVDRHRGDPPIGNKLFAVDPLLEHYRAIYKPESSQVQYFPSHKDDGGLRFMDNTFDYIFCINVIDHTEHWEELLLEIRRVLKPHGRLFFHVNFDWELHGKEHVMLWNWDVVQREVGCHFFPERQIKVYEYEHKRYAFWGVFTKPT